MIINSVISWYFRKRIQQVRYGMEHPNEVQFEIWSDLIKQGSLTKYGEDHGFDAMKSREDYRSNVPIRTYDQLKPYINRIVKGEQQVLWPTEIKWFAKSKRNSGDATGSEYSRDSGTYGRRGNARTQIPQK